MKELLQKIKADMILSALLCVTLGIVVFVWPEKTIDALCKVLAIGLIIMGIVNLCSYFMARLLHPFAGVLGLILLLVGIWIFSRPESVVSLVPIIIGVILAVHGIQDVKMAMEAKGHGYEKWWTMLLIALVSLALGILCIVNAFGLVKLATKIVGVALIYDGVSDLWVINRTVHSAKVAREEEDALNVEYREVVDETEKKN